VQPDRSFEEASRSSVVTFCGEQEIHRMAKSVNSAIQVLPLPTDLNVGFVHPPTPTNRMLATTKHFGQNRQYLQRPTMHRSMINLYAPFRHHFF